MPALFYTGEFMPFYSGRQDPEMAMRLGRRRLPWCLLKDDFADSSH